ncbi:MAG: DUF4381 family protein [Hyphomicrobiaceae bacterium]
MKEDDILAQLRDIHLPEALNATTTTEFVAWPFVVLALAVLAIGVARLWNRNQWRRSARAELSQILSQTDQATQWATLLAFADGLPGRSGRRITLPNTAYLRPETITEDQRSEFISFLNAELRR